MTVSVVMAVFNGERFLTEQMDSFINQSRKPDEVLIADDCSSDSTIALIESYIKKHSLENCWHLFPNSKNKGYGKNFIDLAGLAKGDIIFFADQDDIWKKNKIKDMEKIMTANQDINLLCSGFELFYSDKDTRKWSKRYLSTYKDDYTIERQNFSWQDYHLKRAGCTMCIRRAFLTEITPFWTSDWYHDEFVWKMALLDSSCAILQANLMLRRMHSNNTTLIRSRTKQSRIKKIRNNIMQYNSLLQYAKDKQLPLDKQRIINESIEAFSIRLNFLDGGHLYQWLRLAMEYKNCYPSVKSLFLDLFLFIFGEYRGH